MQVCGTSACPCCHPYVCSEMFSCRIGPIDPAHRYKANFMHFLYRFPIQGGNHAMIRAMSLPSRHGLEALSAVIVQ